MPKQVKFNLFQYRWNLGIIHEMDLGNGARFSHLVGTLGVSRGIMTSTLERLIEAEIIQKNTGYGHPLRPEYLLTPVGKQLAPFCRELLSTTKKRGLQEIIQPRWACPILFTTGEEERRFNEIKNKLSPVTSRALSENLKQLLDHGGMSRRLLDDHPPAILYSLAKKTRSLYSIYKEHERTVSSFCFA